MKRLAVLLAVLAGGCPQAPDAPEQTAAPAPQLSKPQPQPAAPVSIPEPASDEERILRLGMSWDGKKEDRGLSIDEVMAAYAAKGLIGGEPDFRYDYTNLYLLRRPTELLGHRVLMLEFEQIWGPYLGCCVSPGVGAILAVKGDLAPLELFADRAWCTIGRRGTAIYDPYEWQEKLGNAGKGALVEISCRERESRERELD